MHVGTLLCSSCICVSFHSFYMYVCNHHGPVSDIGWNPSCHCDNLQAQEKRFDNSIFFMLWNLFCGCIWSFNYIIHRRANCIPALVAMFIITFDQWPKKESQPTGYSWLSKIKQKNSYLAFVCHFCSVFQRWYTPWYHPLLKVITYN